MNGFKPNAKMGNTCHYSHGGAVMKKAKGGKVMGKSYFEDIPDKENDLLVPGDENSPTIKEDRENRESGTALYEKLYNRDKSDNNTKVSKKLSMEKMPSGAQQYVRGSDRGEKATTLSKYTRNEINKLKPGSGDNDEWEKQYKKVKKLGEAQDDNFDSWDKELGLKNGGQVMKKATGGAINAKKIANPNMPRQPMQPTPTKPRPGMPKIPSTRVNPPRPPRPGMSDPRVPSPRPPRFDGVGDGPRRPLPPKGGIMGSPVKPKGGGGTGSPQRPKPFFDSINPIGPRKPMGPRLPDPPQKVSDPVRGPFGPRNPNGPRKPMGSPSPMSGGIMAGINSMVNKGQSQQSAAQQSASQLKKTYNDFIKAMPPKKGNMMGNGPMGPRNPNGPRKPMPGSNMAGAAGAVINSMFKGTTARKKGGMAKGKK